jgi:hypothetical protein
MNEAGEAKGGNAQGADDGEGRIQVVRGLVTVDEAAHEDAQQGDLVVEAVEGCGFEVGKIDFIEMAGIKAVLEGVLVAARGAAMGFGGRGWLVHRRRERVEKREPRVENRRKEQQRRFYSMIGGNKRKGKGQNPPIRGRKAAGFGDGWGGFGGIQLLE